MSLTLVAMRRNALTTAGLMIMIGAALVLPATGHTEIRTSADAEAPATPWLGVVVPILAGLLLIRLVPLRLPALVPVDAAQRPTLTRQAWALLGIAVLFPVLVPFLGRDLLYGMVKVALLIGAAWLVLRVWRAPSPAAAHRRTIPRLWWALGPVPAIAGWLYLSEYSPLAGSGDLSGYRDLDRVYLVIVMVFVFLTAGVTEEVFYRAWLQTRLEALHGRWLAITVSALLFAAMHVHRFDSGAFWLSLATILAFNGGFGVLTGYLWARYRNLWANIAVHGAVNAVPLLPLLLPG